MFTIIIQEKGGEQRRVVFNKPEVTIGRVQGNDIVLPKGNVSKRHARIVLKDGKFIIVDLKSTNGTYVNGRKITSPLVVKDSDKIYIGDFIVGVDEAGAGESEAPMEAPTAPPPSERPADIRPPRPTEAAPMPSAALADALGPLGGPHIAPRPVPPRPAPAPVREPMPREPAPPMEQRPRDPVGAMPPITAPPRHQRGTMPPPIAPLPSPSQPAGPPPVDVAPPPAAPAQPHAPAVQAHVPAAPAPMPRQEFAVAPSGAPVARPAEFPAPMPSGPFSGSAGSSGSASPAGPAPSAIAAPSPASTSPGVGNGAPAPVVPLASDKAKRSLVGAGAKRVAGRSVSTPSRKGVHLEQLDPKVQRMLDLQANLLDKLRQKFDIDKITFERRDEEELFQRAERATIDLVETLEASGELPKYIDQETLIKETLCEALALGPLEELLGDDKIDEIIIDRKDRVIVGKGGQLRGSGKAFSSDDVFERVVKRLVAQEGAQIDEHTPVVDFRARDGMRITAAVPPVAARGACLVLKKLQAQQPQLSELVGQNSLSSGMADFLATCVAARRNILVCGGPGSGKTTVLGALATASPAGERVVSIEEIAELSLGRDEWIQLETRPETAKAPAIDLCQLLETALRLAPDRLVVGEVRGREALPLISALCSWVDGASIAMTGEGSTIALGRLVTLARATTPAVNDSAVRELVTQAFEIVVHVARWADGTLRVLAIEEIVGSTDIGFDTHMLFQFRDGNFVATGTVPRFYAELEARGIPADQAVFR